MQRRLMTPRGYAQLSDELYHLKTVERPKLIEEIAAARAQGDLSENAEYQFAKEKQSRQEGRIKELESMLAEAEVIHPERMTTEKVAFGATVELYEHETEKTLTYIIVGEHEADIDRGLLSVTAPLARSLLGKEVDDTVVLKLTKTSRTFDIVAIRYQALAD